MPTITWLSRRNLEEAAALEPVLRSSQVHIEHRLEILNCRKVGILLLYVLEDCARANTPKLCDMIELLAINGLLYLYSSMDILLTPDVDILALWLQN